MPIIILVNSTIVVVLEIQDINIIPVSSPAAGRAISLQVDNKQESDQ